jgi:uncharacterized OB-fold protein
MMSGAESPPLPQPDSLTQAYWDACRKERLEVSVCDGCDHLFLPPGPCCPKCWSSELSTREVSGNGRIFSFVVYRRTYHPGIPVPYVVALIELDEGPRLVSNVVGCEPEAVEIDMPVRVRFESAGDFLLPRFEPQRGRNEIEGEQS